MCTCVCVHNKHIVNRIIDYIEYINTQCVVYTIHSQAALSVTDDKIADELINNILQVSYHGLSSRLKKVKISYDLFPCIDQLPDHHILYRIMNSCIGGLLMSVFIVCRYVQHVCFLLLYYLISFTIMHPMVLLLTIVSLMACNGASHCFHKHYPMSTEFLQK